MLSHLWTSNYNENDHTVICSFPIYYYKLRGNILSKYFSIIIQHVEANALIFPKLVNKCFLVTGLI